MIGKIEDAIFEILVWQFIIMQIYFLAANLRLSWHCVSVEIIGNLLQLFEVKTFDISFCFCLISSCSKARFKLDFWSSYGGTRWSSASFVSRTNAGWNQCLPAIVSISARSFFIRPTRMLHIFSNNIVLYYPYVKRSYSRSFTRP